MQIFRRLLQISLKRMSAPLCVPSPPITYTWVMLCSKMLSMIRSQSNPPRDEPKRVPKFEKLVKSENENYIFLFLLKMALYNNESERKK